MMVVIEYHVVMNGGHLNVVMMVVNGRYINMVGTGHHVVTMY